MSRRNRRDFLRHATALGAACALPTVMPSAVFGRDNKPAPSERIAVGMIGVGRQAKVYNIPQFLKMPEVQVAAVCDVDAWRLDNAKRQVEQAYAKEQSSGNYKGCDACVDFQEILGRGDIDAVMISTPDHWHAPIALAALEAGKDVSLEKPTTRCITEGRAIADKVAAHKRIFRVDSEFRSLKHVHHAAQLIRNGRLGRIHAVTVVLPKDDLIYGPQPDMGVPPELDYERWQGPAPPRAPYTEHRVHAPHSYARGGWMRHLYYTDGMITNWGTHLNDGAVWCTGLDHSGPVEIEATGTYPPPDNFWNTLWTFEVAMRFANGLVWTCRTGEPPLEPSAKIEGDNGWISVSFRRIWSEPASLIEETIGPDEIHFPLKTDKQDFIDCVKSREEPLESAEVGQRVNTLGLLGHIAVQVGEKLRWDPDNEQFIDNDTANAFLNKPIHAPPPA